MTATHLGMPAFPPAARQAVRDEVLRANLRRATHTIRDKRARAVAELEDWDRLRADGKAVKDHTLRRLDHYLLRLEAAVTAAGGTVHWAADAAEANRIVTALVLATGEREVVKVKSMATQEIGLNEALEAAGIAAYETDLAELIVQLGHDRPSHILVPAIHRNRAEIRDVFLAEMGRWGRPAPDGLGDDPRELAEAARLHLRAKVAVSGANFMVAETGTMVVFESEGNGRMCLTLPETLISVVGIEKVVPTFRDLEIFLQTLPRSSTAERMNPYTTMWTGLGPSKGADDDGPAAFHLVLLDNGRTDTLADEIGRQALRCIRCSACLNVCPVYERAGGHAYGSVYPGPIGAILSPQLRGTGSEIDASLPYASTLCGACYEVCPVAIDIPEVLLHLRERVVQGGPVTREGIRVRIRPARGHTAERAAMRAARLLLERPGALRAGERLLSRARRLRPRRLPGPGRAWTDSRDLPLPPEEPFRDWWARERGGRA
ncbi:lactate utilization protein B [Streptomyces sp. NPDC091259]|uniref:lactate utilization protein B n=1 Tax=Streptomyces sp. NPDC091259 TaxID=3365976 RepID=UPI00382DC9F3